ncbi:MAG: vWA domain-containing protein, partial [Paracoccaceae bacterium]
MVTLLRPVLCLLALIVPTLTLADGRAIIVLDASGSMWDELDGRPKREIAQEALEAVLQSVPADAELGLMAYGHREKGNCDDIELVVPPAPGAAAAVSSAAAGLNSTGKTPLTAAVAMAAEALDSRNRPATVILITDGLDNCGGDPCALASMLQQTGANFTAHVVGFGLKPDEAEAVSCLARTTGGSYLLADDLATLTLALRDTVLFPATERPPTPPKVEPDPAPPPPPARPALHFEPTVLLSADGPPLDAAAPVTFSLLQPGQTTAADAITITPTSIIPPGNYSLQTSIGAVTVTQPLTVGD